MTGVPGAMVRLDGVLRRHRRVVLGLWLVAVLVSLPFAAHQSDRLTGGGFAAGGSDSAAVERAVARDYPEVAATTVAAVLVPRPDAGPGDLSTALAATERSVTGVAGVRVVDSGRQLAETSARERLDRPVVLPLAVPGGENAAIDLGADLRQRLGVVRGTAGTAADGRVEVHVVGQGALWAAFLDEAKAGVGQAEVRGFPVIAIVLLAVFGSLAAGLLPLGLGLVALLVTGAVIFGLSTVAQMSTFVTNISSMIGIGVAVDYSLFVLARYRQEIRAGRDPAEARSVAMATSGTAVVFSGATVIASLAGLFLISSTALRSMAVGAMVVVAIAVLGTSTLLPVLIGLLGHRVDHRARWARRRSIGPGTGRFLAALGRRGAAVAGAVAGRLGRRADRAGAADPVDVDLQQRAAAAGVRARVPGRGGGRGGRGRRGGAGAGERAGQLHRVGRPSRGAGGPGGCRPRPRGGHRGPRGAGGGRPQRAAASGAAVRPGVGGGPGHGRPAARVGAGGRRSGRDGAGRRHHGRHRRLRSAGVRVAVEDRTVRTDAVVRGPAPAVALGRAAARGGGDERALGRGGVRGDGAIFQWGWLSWLGLEAAPSIDTATPPLVLAVAFGLSMDYEVFLLTRVRERYAATGDTRRAVTEALGESAPVITSAALIMVAVFLAFVSAGLPSVQRLGVGCAVAIALDATVVRLVLVPALMDRLGRWNWWWPAPLARLLPPGSDAPGVPSERESTPVPARGPA